ncbi:hypothetical protein CONCODRAFT_168230 [Conidiobolus coronatus NRRL 28638]|uniref:F-box domain-containing protein n=1 Tax=Conidiobolus coronatus (strain ATCC 28846 / CBS 209.66 / NRRL 28638) TaxID=796925 RepID=A0A137NV90_CONC2|nr:hypothetical protein CONCODRAFT_168230 [Conidiobolus coronatus NRRL 28638]|eukprot:KXN66608.1 hypothetical protein CONCODRAFT_168230 [Conidiobolus coronatus NRRL 28638]
MDQKKLQLLLSLKEIIHYFNHCDIIQISYTCKRVNEHLKPLVRKKLIGFDSDDINKSFKEFQLFNSKFVEYLKRDCMHITYLHAGSILTTTGCWGNLNLLANLQILILEKMEDVDAQIFNTIINGPRLLKTLRLKYINIYVEDVISEVSGYIRLPSNLVELSIFDVDVMLSGLESVEEEYDHEIYYTLPISKDRAFAPETDLSNLRVFCFCSDRVSVIFLDYILSKALNLRSLSVKDSFITGENLEYIDKYNRLKQVSLDFCNNHHAREQDIDRIPKCITELSLNYRYTNNTWPAVPLISYGFKSLKKLSIQYNPSPDSMVTIITGLASLGYLEISGKPYKKDLNNLNFQNTTIKELVLTNIQYSRLNIKIFNRWTGLKNITMKPRTSMKKYHIYFRLCEMLDNWKLCIFPRSVKFFNMNKQ